MHGSTEKHTNVEISGGWVWRKEANKGKDRKIGREQIPDCGGWVWRREKIREKYEKMGS